MLVTFVICAHDRVLGESFGDKKFVFAGRAVQSLLIKLLTRNSANEKQHCF